MSNAQRARERRTIKYWTKQPSIKWLMLFARSCCCRRRRRCALSPLTTTQQHFKVIHMTLDYSRVLMCAAGELNHQQNQQHPADRDKWSCDVNTNIAMGIVLRHSHTCSLCVPHWYPRQMLLNPLHDHCTSAMESLFTYKFVFFFIPVFSYCCSHHMNKFVV